MSRHRLRVAEATLLLLIAQFLVAWVRFGRWRGWLGEIAAMPSSPPVSEGRLAKAWQCAHAIDRACARLEGCKAPVPKCLPRAMALQWMLRRRGMAAVVVIGTARNGRQRGRLGDLHAWLLLGDNALPKHDDGLNRPLLRLHGAPLFRSAASPD